MDIIRSDFKSGLEALLKAKPIRAIFLGVRIGDPTAVFFTILRKCYYILLDILISAIRLLYLLCFLLQQFIRLAKNNSLLVHLDGLLSWEWIQSWIGLTGLFMYLMPLPVPSFFLGNWQVLSDSILFFGFLAWGRKLIRILIVNFLYCSYSFDQHWQPWAEHKKLWNTWCWLTGRY